MPKRVKKYQLKTDVLLLAVSLLTIIMSPYFSLAGFEMTLERHVSHYIITYYLPSGLFVVVSWIRSSPDLLDCVTV